MIETPTATAYTSPSTDGDSTEVDAPLLTNGQKSEKQQLQELEADLFLVKRAPITAKLRTATKHLRSVAGRWSRFRGLHVAILCNMIHSLVVGVFGGPSASLSRPIVSILTTIAMTRLHMTWTQIVISNPSNKSWFRRISSVKVAKNAIIPTAMYAIAKQAAIYVPAALFVVVFETFQHPAVYGGNPHAVQKVALIQMVFIGLLALGTVILIVVPANVTLKRVQASMLPEEDEAIVPFDRTFSGKVKPEILGGSGAVSMLDAWKTFDKEARIRLIKLYGKVFALQIATSVVFAMIAVGELHLIMGDDLQKIRKMAHGAIRGQH